MTEVLFARLDDVLAVGAGAQPLDDDLTAIAALTTTAFGRSLLELADDDALAALVDSFFLTQAEADLLYQPLDADLTAIAALSTTAFGRGLLTLADATALAALVDAFFLTPAEGNAAYQPLDADLTSWAAITRAAGFDTFTATPSLANLGSLLTDEAAGLITFMTTPTSANLAALVTDDAFALSSATLGAISALAVTDGNIIVGDGATWVAESGATARTSLGLGTGDSPTFTDIIASSGAAIGFAGTPADDVVEVGDAAFEMDFNAGTQPRVAFDTNDLFGYTRSTNTFAWVIGSTTEMTLNATNLSPGANDGNALGVSGTAWADLFLASGAVVDFAAGDTTITHSTGLLRINTSLNPLVGLAVGFSATPAADIIDLGDTNFELNFDSGTAPRLGFDSNDSFGYTRSTNLFNWTIGSTVEMTLNATNLAPGANDGNALGVSGTAWADLFLADGGVINWNAGNATLTHSTSLLTSNVPFSVGTSNAITAGSIELSHATQNTLTGSSGDLLVEGTIVKKVGKETIFIPANAMIAAATSGAARSSVIDSGSNDINYQTLDFDGAAEEHAFFTVAFPKNWNESTVTFRAFWTSTATDADGVVWGLAGMAASDSDAINTALGTRVEVTDNAQSVAQDLYVSSESGAVTIAGTPAEGDLVFFRVSRTVGAAGDTHAEDARLLGIQLFFTTNASTDA